MSNISITIERDYVAPGVSLLITLFLIPTTSFLLYNIDNIPYLKSIQDEYAQLKMLCDLYKILSEFICLFLIMPSIIDCFKNFANLDVSVWDLGSYDYLLWALWLTSSIYLYEILTLKIRVTNFTEFKHDLAHWIHHSMHIFIVCIAYFFSNSITYFTLRLAVVYAFWTFFASIPVGYSVVRYLMTKSPKEMYYIYLINSYLFAVGNIIRCISGLTVYLYYFNQLELIAQIAFIPCIVCWSIDQVFASITLRKLAQEQYEKIDTENNTSVSTSTPNNNHRSTITVINIE